MHTLSIPTLDSSLENARTWLSELCEHGLFESELQAYAAFRAVMHALRDRLPAGEAAHLAAELPMMLRGLYYEGWRPTAGASNERTAPDFIETVRGHLRGNESVDPTHATRAVFDFLTHKMSAGEISDVRHDLPHEIHLLWPPLS